MEEQLDILNEKGEKTGESRTRDDAHIYGLTHRAVHVWFLNSKGQLLLQKRSKNMEAYPDCWDVSAGGHISAGQSSLEAAQRETQEELGLSLSPDNLKYLFTVEEHVVLNQGKYINNEFQDVYLVRHDADLSKLKVDKGEVESTRWVSKKDLLKWIDGKGELLAPRNEEYKKLFDYLSSNNN